MAENTTKKNKKEEEIEIIEPEKSTQDSPSPDQNKNDISQYITFLEAMKVTKRHLEFAPTLTPKNFYDQIQFLDDGVDVRLYLWINGTWRYVDLT